MMKILHKNKGMLLFLTILLTFFMTSVSAQETATQITGRVTDDTGEALVGATIIVKGTMVGVATDVDGNFTIRATPSQTLVFTYMGYDDIEITVGKNKKLAVKMSSSDDNTLEEVVVVGYGEMRKSDLTGSVASVKAEVFEDGSVMNFGDALQGQVAGVEVTSNSGTLGGAVSIRIRGSNSLGSSEPLYIIDGVIFDNSDIDNFEEDGSYQSPLASINPSDILSMEILKDASATAIYGSDGSNGVVLITTKSGQSGKPKVSLALSFGAGVVEEFYKVANSNETMLMIQEAYENVGNTGHGIDAKEESLARRGMLKSYNWQDIMTETSTQYNATATVSGGSDDIKYMMSINGFKIYGLVPTNEFQRLTGRVNLTYNINSKLSVTSNINLSQTVNDGIASSSNYGTSGVMGSAISTKPWLSTKVGLQVEDEEAYDEDLEYDDVFNTDNTSTAYLKQIGSTKITKNYMSSANLAFNYTIIPGLIFKVAGNFSKTNTQAGSYQSVIYSEGAYDAGGIAQFMETDKEGLANDYTLTWNKNFGTAHKLSVVGGFSIKQSGSRKSSIKATGFPNDSYLWNDFSAATEYNTDPTNTTSESRSVSWFGRFNYTLMSKYVFTFTGRIDGNSRYAEGNKYSYYPAGAFAWNISQEPWLKGHRTISNLKLRVSLGKTGNKSSASSQAQNLATTEDVVFGQNGVDEEYMGYANANVMKNTQLSWETTTQLSSGLDVSLFKNKLKLELEGYYKYTNNLLTSCELADHTGYTSSYLNYGSMYNYGFELSGNYIILKTKDITLTAGANIARNVSTVDEIAGGFMNVGQTVSWLYYAYPTPLQDDVNLGSFWGYIRDGIRQEGENNVNYTFYDECEVGEQKYIDTNGDGVLDDNDKQFMGSAQAAFSYGLNVSVGYKGLTLRVYGAGRYGNDIFNLNKVGGLRFGYNKTVHLFENSYRWTPDNPTNDYPRLAHKMYNSKIVSRRFIEDGTFFRIKTISLSYRIPDDIVAMARLSSASVNLSISSPFTFTNYTGFNPDASLSSSNIKMGYDNATNPTIQSISLGLNIQF